MVAETNKKIYGVFDNGDVYEPERNMNKSEGKVMDEGWGVEKNMYKKDVITQNENTKKEVYCIECKYADIFYLSGVKNRITPELRYNPRCCDVVNEKNINERMLSVNKMPKWLSCIAINPKNECEYFKKASLIRRIIRYICWNIYKNKIK